MKALVTGSATFLTDASGRLLDARHRDRMNADWFLTTTFAMRGIDFVVTGNRGGAEEFALWFAKDRGIHGKIVTKWSTGALLNDIELCILLGEDVFSQSIEAEAMIRGIEVIKHDIEVIDFEFKIPGL